MPEQKDDSKQEENPLSAILKMSPLTLISELVMFAALNRVWDISSLSMLVKLFLTLLVCSVSLVLFLMEMLRREHE